MSRLFAILLAVTALLYTTQSLSAPSIEGSQGAAWSTGTTLALPAVSTTGYNEPIVVLSAQNGGTDISSVTSPHLTFTKRAQANTTHDIEEWVATSSSPLSSEVITITYVSAPAYGEACAFGVLGTPASGYYDTNASLPVANNTAANPTFSTTAAITLVFGAVRFVNTATGTPGVGWTSIYAPSSGYFVAQYKVFSAPQTGTTFTIGTGSGDENGSIVDAVVAAGAAGVTSQFFFGANRFPQRQTPCCRLSGGNDQEDSRSSQSMTWMASRIESLAIISRDHL